MEHDVKKRIARTLAYCAAIAIAAPVAAQPVADPEIVVTAIPLSQTEVDLKACLARNCPPDEDIRATLAHAENQFVGGDYRAARTTLTKSIGRNRKHQDAFPVPVSNMFRANANVAEHLGEARDFNLSVLGMRDALKNNLPSDDKRVLLAEIEVGDARMKLGYNDEAKTKYEGVEKQALARSLPDVAAKARLRHLSLLTSEAMANREAWRVRDAREAIDAYIAAPTSGAESYVVLAEILKSKLDDKTDGTTMSPELLARYAALTKGAQPILIRQDPIKLDAARALVTSPGGNPDDRFQSMDVDGNWVDIGFWVTADGAVEDAQVLRGRGENDWADNVLTAINTRRYSPFTPSATGRSGQYRVERYTLTAHYEYVSTSRIRQRQPTPRIERIDLTP